MTEEWRPIEGFEGVYDVSNQGRVRRVAGSYQCPDGRIVFQGRSKKGHMKVHLWRKNKRYPRWVHRLVLAAFLGPCPDGMEVRHLNGDATDNRLQNLTYGTHSENELDKVRHGTHRNAAKTHCKRGHEFTPENTGVQMGGKGRYCRACARNRNREIERRRRAGKRAA